MKRLDIGMSDLRRQLDFIMGLVDSPAIFSKEAIEKFKGIENLLSELKFALENNKTVTLYGQYLQPKGENK